MRKYGTEFKNSLSYKMNEEMNQINVQDLKGQFDHRMQQLNNKELDMPMIDDSALFRITN